MGRAAGPALRIAAPAKLNLGLAVIGRRPDGHHLLRSVFLCLELADELAVRVGAPGDPDRLTVEGDPDCPVEGNLVLRALALLRAHPGAGAPADLTRPDGSRPEPPGLTVGLRKRIPMGGGLGGGSSDAAAALTAAAAAWDVSLRPEERLELATALGADVPFFASGAGAALVSGIGADVDPLPPLRGRAGILLATPPLHVSTAAVFAAHDRLPSPGPGAGKAVAALAADWRAGLDAAGLASRAATLRDANDLWAAAVAVAPPLGPLRSTLELRLGVPVMLTGSGATLVGLYPSLGDAQDAQAVLEQDPTSLPDGLRVTVTSGASDQPGRRA